MRPAAERVVGREEEWRPGEGVVLGLGETRSLRCLAGGRCLESGRGRARPCLESSEEEEEERDRERMPAEIIVQRNQHISSKGQVI